MHVGDFYICMYGYSYLCNVSNVGDVQVLCLNNNRIESLLPLSGAGPASNYHCLLSLQVLHLAENGISNLFQLHFESMPSLKALFLQGKACSKVCILYLACPPTQVAVC